MAKNCTFMNPRIWWIAGIALFFGIVFQQWHHRPPKPLITKSATILNTPRAISAFELQDHHNQIFNNETLKNRWTLLFFGFTRCGGICPKVMIQLKKLYDQLPSHAQQQLQIAFISIDPARDDQASLKKFVTAFNKDFLGLRGNEQQIQAMTKELGIVYMETTNEHGEYDIDHSGTLLLFNPAGLLYALFSMPHDAANIASDFQLMLTHYR